MPKKVTSKKEAAVNSKPSATGESVASYFRTVFKEKPKWLKSRSNGELLQRWLQDHPGETEVPHRIKVIMANTKSELRKKGRKGGQKKQQPTEPVAVQQIASAPTTSMQSQEFERLEIQIDECLTLAKNWDREQLASVIDLLRRARNEVVWKLGQ